MEGEVEQQQDPPQEESVPPQTQEEVPHQEVKHEELAPVQEEPAPVQEEKAAPVQEQTAPVEEETSPDSPDEEDEEEEEDLPIDDSLFEIQVFECQAPRGEPAPIRKGPVAHNTVFTLCFRAKHPDAATLQSISLMDFVVPRGPSQAAVRDNESAGPMSRAICPMPDGSGLCITATKLGEDFFAMNYKGAAVGNLIVKASGEERKVTFRHEFSTAESKQPASDHDYFEFPAEPPSFPCGNEIRMWLLAALILTLLEFAFSPSSSDTSGGNDGGAKKKKPKKE